MHITDFFSFTLSNIEQILFCRQKRKCMSEVVFILARAGPFPFKILCHFGCEHPSNPTQFPEFCPSKSWIQHSPVPFCMSNCSVGGKT